MKHIAPHVAVFAWHLQPRYRPFCRDATENDGKRQSFSLHYERILTDHELTLDVDPKDGKAEPLAYLIGSLVELGMDTLWPDKNGILPIGPIEGMIDKVRQKKKSKVAASN